MRIAICIENKFEFFEHEGYYNSIDEAINALQTLKLYETEPYYEMHCPYGLYDCIHDPGYLIKSCPDWYKELYGDNSLEEAVKIGCLPHCKDGSDYDDEDK